MNKIKRIGLYAKNYYIESQPVSLDEMNSLFEMPWQIVEARLYNRKKREARKGKTLFSAEPPQTSLKYTPEQVCGELQFGGLQQKGVVSLSCNFNKEFSPTEFAYLMHAITEWAFSQDDVYTVLIDEPQDKKVMLTALDNLGLKHEETGDGKIALKKGSTSYFASFMCLGIGVGMSIGGCFNNIALGLSFGLLAGIVFGMTLDKKEEQHRRIIEGGKDL